MIPSGITVEELRQWGGDEVFNQALAMVNSGDVSEVAYDDERLELSGKIAQAGGWQMPVKLKLERGGRIKSLCPCITNQKFGQICMHVVAIGLVRAMQELPENAPEEPARGEEEEGDRNRPEFIEVEMAPKFFALVSGSRASLSIELDAWYGDIDFPACSPQAEHTVYLEDPDDPLIRKTRSMKREREAVQLVEKFGFERGYGAATGTQSLRLYLTDPQKVLNFLGSGLPTLRRRGWRVDLSERLMALAESMAYVVPVVKVRDRGEDFEINYAFETGNAEVSPVEIQAALNRGDGYILKDGAVTLLDTAAITAMHEVFRDVTEPSSGGADGWFRVKGVHAPYVKSSLERLGAVEVEDDLAPNWRECAALRNREGGAKFEPVALGELDKVLRPYQKQGVYWMRFLENAGLSGLLADEMGLGKTLQTLTWLSLPRSDNSASLPSIVVCPTSLVRNWEAEARKFTPWRKVLVISGPERARLFGAIDGADLVITSYALLQRDFEEAYREREFAVAVLDEAQHIKNRRTHSAVAAKHLRSRRRLVLTGTPIENSVVDVWSIFDFLMPDYLGDYESFKLGYELPVGEGGAAAENAQAKLKRKLHPFILRRLKKSVAEDLPDKLVKVSYCPMSEETQREYNAVLAKERRGAKTRFQMLALLMKLRQIASRGKVDAFLEQLDEAMDGGHRVLVFSQFVKQLTVLREELDRLGVPYCYLDGSTQDRLGEVNRFNRDPSIPVFLISLMAGGTGLNLTGADMVIHYDPWWNPAVEDQATDRAHRIGQKKRVYVVKLIAADSVEEKVLALQRRKQAVIAATVSTSDAAIIEKLSLDDIAGLLE